MLHTGGYASHRGICITQGDMHHLKLKNHQQLPERNSNGIDLPNEIGSGGDIGKDVDN